MPAPDRAPRVFDFDLNGFIGRDVSRSGHGLANASRGRNMIFFIKKASNKPMRWLWQPPQVTAYFCASRSPGTVFLVSSNLTLVWATRQRIGLQWLRCLTATAEN